MIKAALEQALAAMRAIQPYTDSLVCYASTISEHPPNAIDGQIAAAIAASESALKAEEVWLDPIRDTDDPIGSAESSLAAPAAQHSDDEAVDLFAQAMKDKLAAKRAQGRRGWEYMGEDDLSEMLHDHVEKGDPLDVANFAMFLWSGRFSIAAKRAEPLTDEEIDAGMDTTVLHQSEIEAFAAGVRYAERAHGIERKVRGKA